MLQILTLKVTSQLCPCIQIYKKQTHR